MQFFNFGSPESYCLFDWLTTERGADVAELINTAFENAKENPMFQHGHNPCYCVRSELASLLYEEYLPQSIERECALDMPCSLDDSGEDLPTISQRLLVLAANAISYGSVAEALLRYYGKWAPELERPEIL